ncbi:MAG: radical SAM/SPASM domain-containing protein [Nitrospinota bacterium]
MEVKPLTSLIVEPTNTCNLRCSFCFVTEGMTRDEGFLDLELFKKIIDDTPDLEHLCMHNWGEPLLHKDIFQMFDYAHQSGVKYIVMNTNGTLLTDKIIEKIVASPLNIIRFSIDGSAETFKKIRGVELEKIEKNILKLKEAKEEKRPELSMGVVFTVEEGTQEDVEDYIRHWETIVDHVRTQPKLIQSPRKEPCPEPFGKDYGKLVVLWDGTVIPCCVDYNASLKLGNAYTERVIDLWNNTAINTLREQHESGDFPKVCANCNECETSKTDKRFFYDKLQETI